LGDLGLSILNIAEIKFEAFSRGEKLLFFKVRCKIKEGERERESKRVSERREREREWKKLK